MVATLMSAVTSKKDVVKQSMNNSKSIKNYELNWWHSFIFVKRSLKALEA